MSQELLTGHSGIQLFTRGKYSSLVTSAKAGNAVRQEIKGENVAILWQPFTGFLNYAMLFVRKKRAESEMENLIYIADDEEHIGQMMKTFLENEGYEVNVFLNGSQLEKALRVRKPDLLILDIMMPGEDGLSICSRLRKESTLPIIIVSAKDSPMDRITGLTLGSDDYLVKPFLPLELVARVKALLRRSGLRQEKEEICYACGNLTLWPDSRKVFIEEEDFPVTPLEFDFLHYLLLYKEKAVEKEELMDQIWKYPKGGESRMPDDLVKRLRRKLRDRQATARIETVWGYGYRLTESGGIL